MNTKPLAHLVLAADPYPVPSEAHGHEVGLALNLALRSARLRRRGLRLARDYSGRFLVRQMRSPNIIIGQESGPLPEVLKPRMAGYGLSHLDREAGIPETSTQIAVAGCLLLRLFTQAERGRVTVAFDFRPWELANRRYRLIFYAAAGGRYGADALPLVRADTAEKALAAGLAFLASGPKVG
jgi:hypothetical protein